MFFFKVKILIFQVVKGLKRQKMAQNVKNLCRTLYFRNHTSYDLHLWYTCMCKRIIYTGIFFIFFKIWIFGIIRGEVKGQKMAQNYKRFCPYLRNCTSCDCDFKCTCVKGWYLQHFFSFFKMLIFGAFRGIKGKKLPLLVCFALYIRNCRSYHGDFDNDIYRCFSLFFLKKMQHCKY